MAGKKEMLLKIFEAWCDNLIDLLLTTEEEAILRRDIYDKTLTLTWRKGHVTLLGDMFLMGTHGYPQVPHVSATVSNTSTCSGMGCGMGQISIHGVGNGGLSPAPAPPH